nr:MAG TPA: hypothetical protein [Caudoviricetes sp.]
MLQERQGSQLARYKEAHAVARPSLLFSGSVCCAMRRQV